MNLAKFLTFKRPAFDSKKSPICETTQPSSPEASYTVLSNERWNLFQIERTSTTFISLVTLAASVWAILLGADAVLLSVSVASESFATALLCCIFPAFCLIVWNAISRTLVFFAFTALQSEFALGRAGTGFVSQYGNTFFEGLTTQLSSQIKAAPAKAIIEIKKLNRLPRIGRSISIMFAVLFISQVGLVYYFRCGLHILK